MKFQLRSEAFNCAHASRPGLDTPWIATLNCADLSLAIHLSSAAEIRALPQGAADLASRSRGWLPLQLPSCVRARAFEPATSGENEELPKKLWTLHRAPKA